MNPAGTAHVGHGYTLNDVTSLTRIGLSLSAARFGNTDDRFQAAWDAVVMAIAEADEPPSRRDLVYAAAGGVDRMWAEWRHDHGVTSLFGTAPRHTMYWLDLCAPTASPEPAVVELLALARIWLELNDNDRQALTALATTNSYRTAADMLGMTYPRFANRVRRARARFLELWHEGESPSRLWRVDRRDRTVSLFGEDNKNRYYTITKGAAISQRKPAAEHGNWRRYCQGCKCSPCKSAAQVYNKAQYDRRKSARGAA